MPTLGGGAGRSNFSRIKRSHSATRPGSLAMRHSSHYVGQGDIVLSEIEVRCREIMDKLWETFEESFTAQMQVEKDEQPPKMPETIKPTYDYIRHKSDAVTNALAEALLQSVAFFLAEKGL
jgi:hypothetical protein